MVGLEKILIRLKQTHITTYKYKLNNNKRKLCKNY